VASVEGALPLIVEPANTTAAMSATRARTIVLRSAKTRRGLCTLAKLPRALRVFGFRRRGAQVDLDGIDNIRGILERAQANELQQVRQGLLGYAMRWAAGVVFFCLSTPANIVCAGEARIVEVTGPSRVVVEVNHANSYEIVQALSSYFQFEFEFERSSEATGTIRFNGRLQGSLKQLLGEVLRHNDFIIVHATEKTSGISRVVILNPKPSAPTAEVGEPTASDPATTSNPNRARHRRR
jgi:hypothetical protein